MLGRDVRTVSLVTLGSRVLGLARDVLLAIAVGATGVGSAFAAAFAVPNMFRRLFGEGALSAAFLPIYARLDESKPELAGAFAAATVVWVAVVTVTITALFEIGLGVALLTSGGETRSLSFALMMLTMPYMPLITIAAILGGVLQTHGRFGPWAAAPVILNTLLIAATLPRVLGAPISAEATVYLLAGMTLLAGAGQVAWSLWLLRRLVRWRLNTKAVKAHMRDLRVAFVPVAIGLGALQINSVLDTLIAMYPIWFGPTIAGVQYPLDEKSNAILFYGSRLYQFPLGVFGIAVATAIFPALARAAGSRDVFGPTFRRGVTLSLAIGLPASIGLLLVARPIVLGLFGSLGERFTLDSAERCAAVLACFAVGVWAYSLNQLFARAFYALGDTRSPMRVSLAMVALNALLNAALIWVLREAGLGLATALTGVVQFAVLALLLRGKMDGPLLDADARRRVARIALATALMTASVLLTRAGLLTLGLRADGGPAPALALGGGMTLVGIAVYTAFMWRSPEFRALLSRRNIQQPRA